MHPYGLAIPDALAILTVERRFDCICGLVTHPLPAVGRPAPGDGLIKLQPASPANAGVLIDTQPVNGERSWDATRNARCGGSESSTTPKNSK
jgi:hypothetical protein